MCVKKGYKCKRDLLDACVTYIKIDIWSMCKGRERKIKERSVRRENVRKKHASACHRERERVCFSK